MSSQLVHFGAPTGKSGQGSSKSSGSEVGLLKFATVLRGTPLLKVTLLIGRRSMSSLMIGWLAGISLPASPSDSARPRT